MHDLCYRIIQSKLVILRKDLSEKKYGLILEYGHTFGHAIEWLAQGKLIHGEAVAIGMCIAAELGHKLDYIPQDTVDLHYEMMQKLQLPTKIPDFIDIPKLLEIMLSDNKKTGEGVKYILLEKIGVCKSPETNYLIKVNPDIVKEVLAKYISRNNKSLFTHKEFAVSLFF